jgi:non-heme chloroperoxidase
VNRPRYTELEIVSNVPAQPRATPLLFIHGAYTAAWCWEETFLPYFAEAGYASYALSLSGHGRSRGREHLDKYGIRDYVRDVREVTASLPAPPVMIGHSMGGMVIQKHLEQASAPGAALLASVPPQGLWGSALGLALRRPGLLADLNTLLGGGRVALGALREALFAQPIDDERLQRIYRRMQRESYRAIWDMTLFDLPRIHRMRQSPLLVLGAEHDHLIPASMVEMTARAYGVAAEIFPGMGHGMMLERDWQRVAERVLSWLGEIGAA